MRMKYERVAAKFEWYVLSTNGSQWSTNGSYVVRFALGSHGSQCTIRTGFSGSHFQRGSVNLDGFEPFLGVSRLFIDARILRLLPCEETPIYGSLTLFLSH